MMAATFFAVSSNFGNVNQRSVSQMATTSRIAWSGWVSSRRIPSNADAGPGEAVALLPLRPVGLGPGVCVQATVPIMSNSNVSLRISTSLLLRAGVQFRTRRSA